MNTDILFSSATDNWSTPKDVYEKLNKEFCFNYDPCPFAPNPVFENEELPFEYENNFSKTKNGLLTNWGGCSFVNPPYSDIKNWCKKAYEEWKEGKTVVMLIPSRTDTSYWHDYIMKADEIRFIRGRLKFGNSKNSAPFPSAIVVFKGKQTADDRRQIKIEFD